MRALPTSAPSRAVAKVAEVAAVQVEAVPPVERCWQLHGRPSMVRETAAVAAKE